MRELVSRESRMENASSSSAAAALTLALSSGRRDSFSSRAKVVPDVMLFPSKLGGFAPRSELESAFCESPELDWRLMILGFSGKAPPLPFTTRLGILESRETFLIPATTSSTISSFEKVCLMAVFRRTGLPGTDPGREAPVAPFAMTGTDTGGWVGDVTRCDATIGELSLEPEAATCNEGGQSGLKTRGQYTAQAISRHVNLPLQTKAWAYLIPASSPCLCATC